MGERCSKEACQMSFILSFFQAIIIYITAAFYEKTFKQVFDLSYPARKKHSSIIWLKDVISSRPVYTFNFGDRCKTLCLSIKTKLI